MSTADSGETMALPQGDLKLLESEAARRLLASAVPARFTYTAMDGTPRVLPTWFHWTGDELVMPTFLSAPHVRRAAARLRALRANPDVAITIDTEGFPPNVLLIRGQASVREVDGVVPEYALAARRYLGEEAATAYLAQIDLLAGRGAGCLQVSASRVRKGFSCGQLIAIGAMPSRIS